MKRLLAQIGITYFSVLAAAFYLSRSIVILIGGIAILSAIVFFIIRKTRKTIYLPAMALAAVLACAVNLGYTVFLVEPIEQNYAGTEHTVRAVLTDEEYRSYSKYYYRLKTTVIDGEKVGHKLLLKTLRPLDAEPDDTIVFTSEINIDDNNYYRAKGYFLVSDSFDTSFVVEPAVSHSLYYHAIQLRRLMRRTLDSVLPSDCAALSRAVLIGDKYALDNEVRDSFRNIGASYFIVVSGMHFAVFSALFMFLLKKLNRWVRFALMLFFIILYAAVTGFQPSVLRSGVMIICYVLSRTVYRIPYVPNHLGIAGVILPFIVTPYGAGDIGLILSFYATLAILLWAGPIAKKICVKDIYGAIPVFHPGSSINTLKERVKAVKGKDKEKETKTPFDRRLFFVKLWNAFAMMLSVALAANILMFPISVIVFRAFSPVTLFSSILLYWEIYLILIFSFLICILFWFKPLIILLAYPLMWVCRLVLWIVNGMSSLPFAYIRISELYFFIWVAVCVVLGIAVILYRNKYRNLLPAAVCCAIILLAGSLTYTILQTQATVLEVYPCGNGICASINCGGRLHLLRMDAKSKEMYQIWEKLSYRFSGADTALCLDEGDLKKLRMYNNDGFAISKLLLYDKFNDDTEGENILSFDSDAEFVLDDDVRLKVTVSDDTPVPYLNVCGRSILIVPEDCFIEDIPVDERTADIIVLSKAKSGFEALRCSELIVSDQGELALRTAKALENCYQKVCFTDEGEVRCRLR